jgi:hypothetical protein
MISKFVITKFICNKVDCTAAGLLSSQLRCNVCYVIFGTSEDRPSPNIFMCHTNLLNFDINV